MTHILIFNDEHMKIHATYEAWTSYEAVSSIK